MNVSTIRRFERFCPQTLKDFVQDYAPDFALRPYEQLAQHYGIAYMLRWRWKEVKQDDAGGHKPENTWTAVRNFRDQKAAGAWGPPGNRERLLPD